MEFYLMSPRSGRVANCVNTQKSRQEIQAMFPDYEVVLYPAQLQLDDYHRRQDEAARKP